MDDGDWRDRVPHQAEGAAGGVPSYEECAARVAADAHEHEHEHEQDQHQRRQYRRLLAGG